MRDFLNESSATRFLFPIDGDCLNDRDGKLTQEGIAVTVSVVSAPNATVTVNGVSATEEGGVYRADVIVSAGRNTLIAKNESDGTEASICVFFLPNTTGKYHISVDDNILFLADLTANRNTYRSMFENPYLAVYKKAHDLYDAKVHLNIFYAFDREAAVCFSDERPDFDLSMMTDRFKEEWEANADWLRLSFHSYAEMPDKPYLLATPEQIVADYEAVRREVVRFAGEKVFSNGVTMLHWGEANPACVAALRDLGYRVLTGYFELGRKTGEPVVAYYAPTDLTKHVGERDFWYDTEMGMGFGRIDRVTNLGTLESVMEDVRAVMAHPHRGGFVSLMIHEQYYHKDYVNYLSDFEARVLDPAKLLYENGYCGSFIKDVIEEMQ